jgi:hypothetical protein
MKRVDTMSQNSLRDKVKRIQELRRSNAAQPVRNKKKYFRKVKHKRRVDLTE